MIGDEQHWVYCAREAGGSPAPGESALEFLDRVVLLATGKPANDDSRKATYEAHQ